MYPCLRQRSVLVAFSLIAPAVLASAAQAQPVAEPPPVVQTATTPGYQKHDGFYLRLIAGPGYTTMSSSEGSDDVSVHGGGAGFSLAIGGALSENLVLFGELLGDRAFNPTFTAGGRSVSVEDVSAGLSGFGGGVAYYLMPINIYFSGALTLTQLTIQDEKNDRKIGETKYGPGLDITAGKEWWVSPNWGLGVAAQLALATMKDKEAGGASWTALGFSVALSATFN
jgi:hypothetical protein